MIEKYAFCVIHEGVERQIQFNNLFMFGILCCLEALDLVDDIEEYLVVVSMIVGGIRKIDPQCASALFDYIMTIINEVENCLEDEYIA